MNKTSIIAIIAVIAVGAGVYFVVSGPDSSAPDPVSAPNEDNTPTNEEGEETEEVIITYTDDGYEPNEVAISAGTQVTFVNESSSSMWPASDIHPTHGMLPEFDPSSPVAQGETYSYTFTETGNWSFHDHMMPSIAGEIVVE